MAASQITDKRVLARELHRRGTTYQNTIDQLAEELPDLSERVAPAPEDIENLREELIAEHATRSARIEQSLERYADRGADMPDPEMD